MKKWILTSIISSSIVLVATANETEKKVDYLANKKKNIESRGNKYDEKQWSDHFDAQDLNKDGALSAEEKTAYKASQKASKNTAKKIDATVMAVLLLFLQMLRQASLKSIAYFILFIWLVLK